MNKNLGSSLVYFTLPTIGFGYMYGLINLYLMIFATDFWRLRLRLSGLFLVYRVFGMQFQTRLSVISLITPELVLGGDVHGWYWQQFLSDLHFICYLIPPPVLMS